MDFLTYLLIILNRLLFDFVIRGIDMGSQSKQAFQCPEERIPAQSQQ